MLSIKDYLKALECDWTKKVLALFIGVETCGNNAPLLTEEASKLRSTNQHTVFFQQAWHNSSNLSVAETTRWWPQEISKYSMGLGSNPPFSHSMIVNISNQNFGERKNTITGSFLIKLKIEKCVLKAEYWIF